MRRTEYVVPLGPGSRYRHYHVSDEGRIIEFRVQYELYVRRRWYPVVRYDTAHGFAHRDLMDFNGVKSKTPLFTSDYNEALTFAESDIKSNWEIYKTRFAEGYDG